MTQGKIGFIGGGHMTSNFLAGLVANSEFSSEGIVVFDRNADKLQNLSDKFNVGTAANNLELVHQCDIVVLSVKPQGMLETLQPLVESLNENKPLIISLAAGITIETFESWLGEYPRLIRAMPNMPSSVGFGASGLYARVTPSEIDKQVAEKMMSSIGIYTWVNSDLDIDSITGLSGSSPAYFMLFAKHLAEAAENAGLDPFESRKFATQTMMGSAELIAQNNYSIDDLITGIQTKGGTTEQAVLSFSRDGLAEVVDTAFRAAKDRATELSKTED